MLYIRLIIGGLSTCRRGEREDNRLRMRVRGRESARRLDSGEIKPTINDQNLTPTSKGTPTKRLESHCKTPPCIQLCPYSRMQQDVHPMLTFKANAECNAPNIAWFYMKGVSWLSNFDPIIQSYSLCVLFNSRMNNEAPCIRLCFSQASDWKWLLISKPPMEQNLPGIPQSATTDLKWWLLWFW